VASTLEALERTGADAIALCARIDISCFAREQLLGALNEWIGSCAGLLDVRAGLS